MTAASMFKDKRIIITGASAGIGAELAVALCAQGARVALAARTTKALEEVVARCQGGEAFALTCDVANQESCRQMVEQATGKLGGLDALVNNAGVSMRARFDDIQDLSIFEQLIRVNYLGAVYCTHYALPELKKTKGLIVAVSSVVGKIGAPTRTGYAASKHAMQGFFDSLRIELAPSGIDVCVVSPGPVQTEIRGRVLGTAATPVNRDAEKKMMSVDECVRIIVDAMEHRKRDVVMGGGVKLAMWMKLFAPGMVDDRVAEQTKKIS